MRLLPFYLPILQSFFGFFVLLTLLKQLSFIRFLWLNHGSQSFEIMSFLLVDQGISVEAEYSFALAPECKPALLPRFSVLEMVEKFDENDECVNKILETVVEGFAL